MRIKRVDGGWAFIYTIRDDAGMPLRVLRIGGGYQSATYLDERWSELPFEYYRAFDAVFETCRGGVVSGDEEEVPAFPIADVLVIGGGGCSYPKHVMMHRDDVRIDVVERDARVARIARRFFFVDRLEDELRARGEGERFRLMVADGIDYLRSCPKRYDAIVNDAFVGRMPVADFMEHTTLLLVKQCLTNGGMYVTNFVVGDEAADLAYFQASLDALHSVFAHVHVVTATDAGLSDTDNFIVIATDGSYAIRGALEV